jgi:transaldolase
MARVFNLGLAMVLAVAAESVEAVLAALSEVGVAAPVVGRVDDGRIDDGRVDDGGTRAGSTLSGSRPGVAFAGPDFWSGDEAVGA